MTENAPVATGSVTPGKEKKPNSRRWRVLLFDCLSIVPSFGFLHVVNAMVRGRSFQGHYRAFYAFVSLP